MLDFKFRNRAKIDSSGWKKTALWEGRENDKKNNQWTDLNCSKITKINKIKYL